MYLTAILFSAALIAAAGSTEEKNECHPEAKDQVAWKVVKALERQSFYLFKSTNVQSPNCSTMKVNQTNKDNYTATLVVRSGGEWNATSTATLVGTDNHLNITLEEDASEVIGSYPVWYTDNATCVVLVDPDETEIVLWVAGNTTGNASFDECCTKIFEREANKTNGTIYERFPATCPSDQASDAGGIGDSDSSTSSTSS
uniref:Putative salivary lipocalin n=1 Tax=Ornithodoros turicata TaxID=34597 RepID=A0A2R5L4A2_9ACAR